MSTKAARGTKRTCQSDECGARFYDLNRDPIVCPICGSIYALASVAASALPASVAEAEPAPRARPKKPEDEEEGGVAVDLADAEDDAGDTLAADDDETFLEEDEEDGGDVTTIIGSVGDDEEEV